MFLCASVFIFYVALSSVSSVFSEKTLLCSSEYMDIWYSYEGPLYYLSATVYPCYPKRVWYTINYTVIPMFTVARAGYHARVYFKNQLWFEYVQPDVPCEDVKICYIIKGETLQESCPFYYKRNTFFFSEGEYHIYVDVSIVDDVNRNLTLRLNITLEVKTVRKNSIFEQLGRQPESCS